MTFGLAVLVSFASTFFLERIASLFFGFVLLLIIILINVVFDAVGTAATAATEPPFHAKAADRVAGASEAVMLIRNADRVANFCGDVVGDVCGTISGAIGAAIALRILLQRPTWEEVVVGVVMSSLIATLTVVGKAAGKTLAITEANDIIFMVGRILAGAKTFLGLKPRRGRKYPRKK